MGHLLVCILSLYLLSGRDAIVCGLILSFQFTSSIATEWRTKFARIFFVFIEDAHAFYFIDGAKPVPLFRLWLFGDQA